MAASSPTVTSRTSGSTCLVTPMQPSSTAALATARSSTRRSEEHTSELQSQSNLVCRLLLEKKKPNTTTLVILKKLDLYYNPRAFIQTNAGTYANARLNV